MKKFIIIMVTVLCIFTVAAVSFTFICIQQAMPADTVTGNGQKNSNEKGIDLNGTFDENDLEVLTVTEFYNDTEVGIPRISGLKNKKVEDKINDEIYQKIYTQLKKYDSISYASFYTRANFANVISISYSISDSETYEVFGLNYELTAGTELKLEDLFLSGTDLLALARNAFFDEVTMRDGNFYESGVANCDENELYRIVKGYMNGEERNFTFSSAAVYLHFDDYMAEIDMLENAEKVTVYSKYLTDKSIFEREDIGFKGAFTCSNISYEPFEIIEYGYAEENLWYDFTVWQTYIDPECPRDKAEKFDEFKKELFGELQQSVEEYRETAKNNPDKMYIVLDKPNLNMYEPGIKEGNVYVRYFTGAATLNHTVRIYEMDREYFETVFKDELINAYRYRYFAMAGGAYLYVEENPNVKVTEEISERMFNYVKNVEYTQVSEMFKNDSYLEVLKNETERWLIENIGYVEETVTGKADEAVYSISTWGGIKVTFPDIDSHLVVDFEEFDKDSIDFFE